MKVKDMSSRYTLIQNEDEVNSILADLPKIHHMEGYAYLFVEVLDGEYGCIFGAYTANLEDRVYKIQ